MSRVLSFKKSQQDFLHFLKTCKKLEMVSRTVVNPSGKCVKTTDGNLHPG